MMVELHSTLMNMVPDGDVLVAALKSRPCNILAGVALDGSVIGMVPKAKPRDTLLGTTPNTANLGAVSKTMAQVVSPGIQSQVLQHNNRHGARR